jgi:hypothetical protein
MDLHLLRKNRYSESQAQCKLQLTRSIRVSGAHEIGWNLVIGREVLDSTLLIAIVEAGAQRAIVSELKTAVQPIKKIERFGSEFQLPSVFCEQPTRDPHIRTGVIGTGE